ncbi:MAG: hypothetical protein ACOC40_01125 [Thermoplasmatota archaeon]
MNGMEGTDEKEDSEENLPNTVSGVKLMSFGYIAGVIGMFLVLLMGISSTFLGETAVLFLCGGGIVNILSIVLFLIGLFFLFKGKREYTLKHSKSVTKGLIMLVSGIILLGSPLLVFLFGTGKIDGIEVIYTIEILAVLALSLVALSSVFLIKELSVSKIKKILWAGAGVNIGGPIIGALVLILMVERIIPMPQNRNIMSGLTFLPYGLSIVGYLLFTISYRKTYKRVKRNN